MGRGGRESEQHRSGGEPRQEGRICCAQFWSTQTQLHRESVVPARRRNLIDRDLLFQYADGASQGTAHGAFLLPLVERGGCEAKRWTLLPLRSSIWHCGWNRDRDCDCDKGSLVSLEDLQL